MASNLNTFASATPRATSSHPFQTPVRPLQPSFLTNKSKSRIVATIRASDDGKSYLDMWRNAVEREKKSVEFENIAGKSQGIDSGGREGVDIEKKSEDFKKILEVSREERDRIQRMQVIDRAAAAIAAARALIKERGSETADDNGGGDTGLQSDTGGGSTGFQENKGGAQKESSIFVSRSETSGNEVPGPDFWSWTPPSNSEKSPDDFSDLLASRKPAVYPTSINPVAVKESSIDFLSIPFESRLSDTISNPVIPPLQSMMEVEKVEVSESSLEASSKTVEEHELGSLSSVHAAEVARVLEKDKENQFALHGINPDRSRWWKETGMERRPDGVICRWTMFRGVSADQETEWQEKFWEAADDFGHKELGSEKSGRDVFGNVWREFWRESMWQESGLVHLEKTADKWGKNGKGDEWQEKWWEHYDASGKADKWAHKWCSIDPTTPLEAGHAHVWHERWGEKYDGYGGSIKYTDKWAERREGDGWSKWGDKWDENFDTNGHGVKQGETWWAGKHGEQWNRTWGERHNGSGWVHKYGKSSSGEHWDTHVQQDTWYERFPHYGFYHCFDNSVQLRQVQKPSEGL